MTVRMKWVVLIAVLLMVGAGVYIWTTSMDLSIRDQIASIRFPGTGNQEVVPDGSKVAEGAGVGIPTPVARAVPTPIPTATAVPTPIPTAAEADGSNNGCITTGEAQQRLGVDVERITSEYCAWNWRGGNTDVQLLPGWLLTIDPPQRDVVRVFDGNVELEQKPLPAYAFTARYVAGFPANDAVHDRCELLAKEIQNGLDDTPSFVVIAGNFSCDNASSSAETVAAEQPAPNTRQAAATSATTLECPEFGGAPSSLGNDGSDYCKVNWDADRGTITMVIPEGWTADTDTMGVVAAGQEATFGSATFRPVE